jgi:hypothetical protein
MHLDSQILTGIGIGSKGGRTGQSDRGKERENSGGGAHREGGRRRAPGELGHQRTAVGDGDRRRGDENTEREECERAVRTEWPLARLGLEAFF